MDLLMEYRNVIYALQVGIAKKQVTVQNVSLVQKDIIKILRNNRPVKYALQDNIVMTKDLLCA